MAARRASRHRVRTSAIKTFQHGGDQIAQRPQQAAPGGLHHAAARAESDRPAAPARDDTVVADVATAKTHRAAAELLDANRSGWPWKRLSWPARRLRRVWRGGPWSRAPRR